MQLLLKTQINTDSNNNVAFCSTPELKKKANMFSINRRDLGTGILKKWSYIHRPLNGLQWLRVFKDDSEKLYRKLVIYLISDLQQCHSE